MIVSLFIYKAKMEKNFAVFQQNKDCSALFLEEKSHRLFIDPSCATFKSADGGIWVPPP